MMRKFIVLTRLQLRALLASLQVGRSSRKRASSGWAALALVCGLCLYISGFYSFGLGGQLAQSGALDLLLLMMPGTAVIAGLVFTAFAAQGVVFGGRDADLLLSMPVSAFTVLLSKLTALYVENLAVCVFLVLPAGAARLWYGGGGVMFVVRLVIGVPFLAMLPTVLALAAGFLLSWLGGRFANHKLVSTLLYGLMMAVVIALAIKVNMAITAVAVGTVSAALGKVPAWGALFQLFQRGVCGDWKTLVAFCLLSLVPVLLAAWLFAQSYQQVLTGLRSHGRRAGYRITRLNAAGRRMALLKKEASRYFGTPVYLFNTGIGLIMLVAAGIAAAVMGGGFLEQLAQAGLEALPLAPPAAAAMAFCLSTVAITGSSISLEGRNLWILKEAPVTAGELLFVKAGFQLLLEGPCVLAGTAGLAWGLGLTPAEGAVLLLAGLAFGGFTALLGLAVNLCFPKLDAVNDLVVVKHSMASVISTFGGMGAAAACGLLVWALYGTVGALGGLFVCTLLLLAGCGALAGWLKTGGAKRFMEL